MLKAIPSVLIGLFALLGACNPPPSAAPANITANQPASAAATPTGVLAPTSDSDDVTASLATCSDLGGATASRIAACTAVIQSSGVTLTTRSRALNNRGVLLSGNADNDGAIADYDAALQINPQYAAAYYNRAAAWRRKGDAAQADADAAEAVKLQPTLAGK